MPGVIINRGPGSNKKQLPTFGQTTQKKTAVTKKPIASKNISTPLRITGKKTAPSTGLLLNKKDKKPFTPLKRAKPGSSLNPQKKDRWVGITAVILSVLVIILFIIFITILVVKSNAPIVLAHEDALEGKIFNLEEGERLQFQGIDTKDKATFLLGTVTEESITLLPDDDGFIMTDVGITLIPGQRVTIPFADTIHELSVKLDSIITDEEDTLIAEIIFIKSVK